MALWLDSKHFHLYLRWLFISLSTPSKPRDPSTEWLLNNQCPSPRGWCSELILSGKGRQDGSCVLLQVPHEFPFHSWFPTFLCKFLEWCWQISQLVPGGLWWMHSSTMNTSISEKKYIRKQLQILLPSVLRFFTRWSKCAVLFNLPWKGKWHFKVDIIVSQNPLIQNPHHFYNSKSSSKSLSPDITKQVDFQNSC